MTDHAIDIALTILFAALVTPFMVWLLLKAREEYRKTIESFNRRH